MERDRIRYTKTSTLIKQRWHPIDLLPLIVRLRQSLAWFEPGAPSGISKLSANEIRLRTPRPRLSHCARDLISLKRLPLLKHLFPPSAISIPALNRLRPLSAVRDVIIKFKWTHLEKWSFQLAGGSVLGVNFWKTCCGLRMSFLRNFFSRSFFGVVHFKLFLLRRFLKTVFS